MTDDEKSRTLRVATVEDKLTAVIEEQTALVDRLTNLVDRWRAKAASISRHPQNSLLASPPTSAMLYAKLADELETRINGPSGGGVMLAQLSTDDGEHDDTYM